MNTASKNPAAGLPTPIPVRVNQPGRTANVPGWWPSTTASPATANPIKITYSAAAMATWVRAVIRIPAPAITSMTTMTAVAMAMFGPALVAGEPNMASTEGARTTTPASEPIRLPVTISQPVMNPR
jgi:hypothetical protein